MVRTTRGAKIFAPSELEVAEVVGVVHDPHLVRVAVNDANAGLHHSGGTVTTALRGVKRTHLFDEWRCPLYRPDLQGLERHPRRPAIDTTSSERSIARAE